ncbi:late competence development ComFB family protein [Brachyspira pilosicoli]|uniref:late competence development ComFB family protein n=1 Tax=Brachyspira pilosicoli TaxID=52584 RepID=UPI00300506CB
MYLVNLMEQKVSKLADAYLQKKNIPVNSNMRMDIIAYTLNRVKPEYVTSARGVLYSYKDPIEDNKEVLNIISQACEVVTKRRESNASSDTIPVIEESGYYITYPSIMGNLFASNNTDRIESAKVYMFSNNALLKGYGVNFPNPAIVAKNVAGKYMFCFMPQKTDSNKKIDVNLDIVVEAENYQKFKSSLTFTVQPEYYNAGDMPLFSVEEVNDISLVENK